jgi:hypothetical protein
MKRPSYLQQAATTQSRRGTAVLSPPRLAFPPGGVTAEFAVREASPPAMPSSAASSPARLVREPAPTAAKAVPRLHQATHAAAAAMPSATPDQASPLPTTQRMAPLSPPLAILEDRPPTIVRGLKTLSAATTLTPDPAVPPTAEPLPGRGAAPTHQTVDMARNEVAAAPSGRRITSSRTGMLVGMRTEASETMPAGIATTDPRLPARLGAGTEAQLTPVENRPIPSPAAFSQRRPTKAEPAVPTGAEAAPSVPAHAALPVLVPPPPPPRAPVAPAPRDHTQSGLHIGTLEVRVTPPPALLAAPSRPAPRQAATRTGGGRAAPIARGFGLFGLGQS